MLCPKKSCPGPRLVVLYECPIYINEPCKSSRTLSITPWLYDDDCPRCGISIQPSINANMRQIPHITLQLSKTALYFLDMRQWEGYDQFRSNVWHQLRFRLPELPFPPNPRGTLFTADQIRQLNKHYRDVASWTPDTNIGPSPYVAAPPTKEQNVASTSASEQPVRQEASSSPMVLYPPLRSVATGLTPISQPQKYGEPGPPAALTSQNVLPSRFVKLDHP